LRRNGPPPYIILRRRDIFSWLFDGTVPSHAALVLYEKQKGLEEAHLLCFAGV
jgi:hypothetical protein